MKLSELFTTHGLFSSRMEHGRGHGPTDQDEKKAQNTPRLISWIR